MTKKIIEEIQQLLVRKRVNFLIGSGASLPAIGLMGDFLNQDGRCDAEKLKKHILTISWGILNPEHHWDKDGYTELDAMCLTEKDSKIVLVDSKKADIRYVSEEYKEFIKNLINILNKSNSRNSPKNINIFTTNYDLFLENAVESQIHNNPNLIFNDGANGYFNRKLDSFNFDRKYSYRNQFESVNVDEEMPSISLLKPHGSMNWEMGTGDDKSDIFIRNYPSLNPVVVPPDGKEAENTYALNHYYEMLRLFQVELSKPESVLVVFCFSFGDQHIAKMVQRALSNPQIMVYVFSYSDAGKQQIKENLKTKDGLKNLKVLGPEDILDNPNKSDYLNLERLNNVVFKIGDFHAG